MSQSEKATDLIEDAKFNKTLINTTTDGYLLVSLETDDILDVNPAYCQLSGYTREQLLEMTIHELDINLQSEKFKHEIEGILDKGAGRFESRHKHRNGDIIHVEISLTVMSKKDGDFVVAFVRDISDEKEAQRKLKQSEERWERLVRENPQPIQVTQDAEIIFINQSGVELYGANSAEEIIGKSVYEFSDPEKVDKIKERKRRLENEEPVEEVFEHKINCLDGERRYVEIYSIPTTYKDKSTIQSVIYNVTERKKKEQKMIDSLDEKEMLLREIHHRVKNNLSVISGLLELQALNTDDKSTLDTLRDSQQRIHSMAMIHKKLYQSEALSDIGFDRYLKELIESISRTYDTDKRSININFDLQSVSLNLDQAIPCSLIVNEVIVNCYKHAFGESEDGEIIITSKLDDSEMIVEIEDDGRGLPDDFSISEQQSLGMTLIQTLAQQLEGEIDFSSNNGAGTIFKLRFETE